MSGASIGCSQPAPCPGRAPMRRCRNRGETKHVVFIDVDSDSFDNVIIIDVPESSDKTFCASNVLRKDRKRPSPRRGVICLDDDENTDLHFPSSGVKNDGNINSGASASMRSHRKSCSLGSSSEAVADECQFIRENVCPVKLSKCKRTYSGKTSARNRYGLGTDSESCPSDSDYPECELMEDSVGRVREQWEKASLRRKCDSSNGQSGVGCPDMTLSDVHQNVDVANDCGQHKDTSLESKNGEEKEVPAPSVSKENGNVGCSYNYGKGTYDEDDDYCVESILKAHFPPDKDDPLYRMSPPAEGPSWDSAKGLSGRYIEKGGSTSCGEEEQGRKVPSSFPHQEQRSVQVNDAEKDFQDRKRIPPGEPCLSKEESYADLNFCHAKANLSEPYVSHSKDSVTSERGQTRSCSGDREKIYQETTTFNSHFQLDRSHKFNSAEEKFASEQASSLKSGSSSKHVNNGFSPSNDKDGLVPGGTSLYQSSVSDVDSSDGKDSHPDNLEHALDEVQTGEVVKSMSNSQQEHKRHDPVHAQIGEAMRNIGGCIISEREKLKETDAYKRAIEEEWASRQRALRIQAEEAQQLRRLLKRTKAERMRLLDMERRQKQRVEEIRETQKKDEESMNMKENIRAQVRKELHQLEVRCHDMASLLQGLGTFGSNLVNPSLDETYCPSTEVRV